MIGAFGLLKLETASMQGWRALRNPSIAIVIAALAASSAAQDPMPAPVPEPLAVPHITVHGSAVVRRRPSLANLRFEVSGWADTAKDADAQQTANTRKLTDALRAKGVLNTDLQVGTASTLANFAPASSGELPKVGSYQSAQQVTVTVRDFATIGDLLIEANRAGAVPQWIEWTMADPSAFENDAYGTAVRDARRRAELLAEQSGVVAGAPLRIIEESRSPWGSSTQFPSGSLSPPRAPDDVWISVSLLVSYELLPRAGGTQPETPR